MALPQAVRMIAEIKARLIEMSGFLVPSGVILMWGGSADTIPRGWALCDGTNGTPDLLDRFVVASGKNYPQGSKGGAASATPEVSTGTAKTGIGLADAAPKGTAGSSVTGIGIQKADLNISTGTAGTGISIQGTTLDGNTLPNHNHSITTCADNGSSNSYPMGPGDTQRTQTNWTNATGNSWGHAHGVSDPGHAHAIGSSEHTHEVSDPGHTHAVATEAHNHALTDGGHSHTVTAKAIGTVPPYYALCFIQKL